MLTLPLSIEAKTLVESVDWWDTHKSTPYKPWKAQFPRIVRFAAHIEILKRISTGKPPEN